MKHSFFGFLSTVCFLLVIINLNAASANLITKANTRHADKKRFASTTVGTNTTATFTKNIEYDFAKASIRPLYYEKLNMLAKYSIDNDAALVLRGYADSIGSFKGNWVISDQRAKNVKNYLVKRGVSENKIVTTPFGNTKPIASNKTQSGRQRNRRVEIKINQVQN